MTSSTSSTNEEEAATAGTSSSEGGQMLDNIIQTTTTNGGNDEEGSHNNETVTTTPSQTTQNSSSLGMHQRQQRVSRPLHVDVDDNNNAQQHSEENGDTIAGNSTNDNHPHQHLSSTDQAQQIFEERFGKPSRKAIRDFFYPRQDNEQQQHAQHATSSPSSSSTSSPPPRQQLLTGRQQQQHDPYQEEQDRLYVENFWKTYDDIVFISLFTQVGMVFRLAAAKWFSIFDDAFRPDSALFVNLPLNCLASFCMGFLCDGPSLMAIVETRFTPQELQQTMLDGNDGGSTTTTPDHVTSMTFDHDDDDNNAMAFSPSSSLGDHNHDDNNTYHDDDESSLHGGSNSGLRRRRHFGFGGGGRRRLGRRRGQRQRQRRTQGQARPTQWTTPQRVGDVQLREVQLLALERRIRASPCLVLFPVKKEDVDVMDHYFAGGYQRHRQQQQQQNQQQTTTSRNDNEEEQYNDVEHCRTPMMTTRTAANSNNKSLDTVSNNVTMVDSSPSSSSLTSSFSPARRTKRGATSATVVPRPPSVPSAAEDEEEQHQQQQQQETDDVPGVDRDLDQIIHDVSANITHNIQDVSSNITTNISRMRRVSLAEGWDVGTTAQAMSDDLLLGLRDGFCGALSTFSSWSSSMVNLLRNGQVSDAVVGYVIGIQLPIVAYRFGQNMAVYLFIWRCRKETRRDERRGYGIRLPQADEDSDSDEDDADANANGQLSPSAASTDTSPDETDVPSVRAIATAIFTLSVVTQLTSLSFFTDPTQHQIALALFFSPLGVLTRWRISRYNRLIVGFPVGTFISNMLGCALSGSLGQLLAGNPGPRERIVLQSLIRGFAGSLSSVSALVVEVLAGTDPLLFRFDGFTYAACTIFWGMIIGFVVETTLDWAESTPAVAAATDDDG